MKSRDTKVVAYLRVSSSLQADESRTGYERQLEVVKNWAGRNGYHINRIFKEEFTGAQRARPVLQKVLEILKPGDMILVESADRFTRSVDGMGLLFDLVALSIDLVDCSTGETLTQALNGHPVQEFLVKVRLLVAEFDKKLICYRLRKGREVATQRNGGKYVAGRKTEYPPELKKRIRLLRSKGNSFNAIAQRLNDEGLTTCNGRPFYGQLLRSLVN